MLKVTLHSENLDRVKTAHFRHYCSDGSSFTSPFLLSLEEQGRVYGLMSQGIWKDSEIASGLEDFFDGGFLGIGFFATFLKSNMP